MNSWWIMNCRILIGTWDTSDTLARGVLDLNPDSEALLTYHILWTVDVRKMYYFTVT